MTVYARDLAPRGSYFFNLRLMDRNSDLLVEEIETLRRAMRETMARYPFDIDAIVVLPAEILTIWTLPDGDKDHATRWSMLKTVFLNNLIAFDASGHTHLRAGENHVWQRRMVHRRLRSRLDFENHCRHIHTAPVSAGYVRMPEQWNYSSVHRDMCESLLQRHKPPRIGLRMPWSARQRALRVSS